MGKYQKTTDLDILRRITKYDSRALEEIYDRYSALLFTLISKIVKDDKVAEEILVEVFSIVWKRAHSFDFENGSAYTWLITLTRNRAVDYLRRNETENYPDVYNEEFEKYFIVPHLAKDIDNLDLDIVLDIKPKMQNAMDSLTDAQKYVINLAFYEGRNLNEIAAELNIPVETVRSKVMTALHSLRDNLLEEKTDG